MKKIFIVSMVMTLVVLLLFISGAVSFGNGAKAALAQGNRHFAAGDLEKALESYAAGLEKAPEDPVLNYNAAQALYSLKEFGQASGCYEKGALKKVDRYLNMGNSFLRLADTLEDENQKQQLYQQALKVYQEGILEFPQEVSLKYNYEFVREKLKQNQQNSGQSQENNEERDNNEGQDEQEKGGSEDQQSENQDNQNQGQDGNEENQDQEQEGNKNSGSNGSEDQQDQQQDQQQQSQSGEAGEDKEDGSEDSSGESPQSYSEIEQALRALEQQEAESLKNNQTIRGSGKEDKYDW